MAGRFRRKHFTYKKTHLLVAGVWEDVSGQISDTDMASDLTEIYFARNNVTATGKAQVNPVLPDDAALKQSQSSNVDTRCEDLTEPNTDIEDEEDGTSTVETIPGRSYLASTSTPQDSDASDTSDEFTKPGNIWESGKFLNDMDEDTDFEDTLETCDELWICPLCGKNVRRGKDSLTRCSGEAQVSNAALNATRRS